MTGWRDRNERDFGAPLGSEPPRTPGRRWLIWVTSAAVAALLMVSAAVVLRPLPPPPEVIAAIPDLKLAQDSAAAFKMRLGLMSRRVDEIVKFDFNRATLDDVARTAKDVDQLRSLLQILDEHKNGIAEFEKQKPRLRQQLEELAKRSQTRLDREVHKDIQKDIQK